MVSKHHMRTTQPRACVGGRWAGPDADSPFPCTVRDHHTAECDELRKAARLALAPADAKLEDLDEALRFAHQCTGCQPRRAVSGWLCESCHTYLVQWLGDGENSLEWAYGWLGANLVPLRTNYPRDDNRRGGEKLDRMEALMSMRELISDRVMIAEEHARYALDGRADLPPIADLPPFDMGAGLAFLRRWLLTLEDDQLFIADLFRKMQDAMLTAHGMAPWRKQAVKVAGPEGRIACPNCQRKTLVQCSGDDFVTCDHCHCVVTDSRFNVWTRMIEDESA